MRARDPEAQAIMPVPACPPGDEPEVEEVDFEPTADVTLRDLSEDELEELLGWRLL